MKLSRGLTTLAILVIFGLGTTSNWSAQAEETKTSSSSNWFAECNGVSSAPIAELTKVVQAKATQNFKWSKKDTEDVNYAVEVFSLNCSEITQEFWEENGVEIKAEFTKSRKVLNDLYARYLKSLPSTISCYKAGVIKKISGKSPVCPKGFKQVKK